MRLLSRFDYNMLLCLIKGKSKAPGCWLSWTDTTFTLPYMMYEHFRLYTKEDLLDIACILLSFLFSDTAH